MGAFFGKESYEDCVKKCQNKKQNGNDFVVVGNQDKIQAEKEAEVRSREFQKRQQDATAASKQYYTSGRGVLKGGVKKKINRKSSKKRKLKKNKKKSLKRKK